MTDAPRAASGHVLLALLVAIAACHGVATAFVRPMFQVSDEVAYFAAAQGRAHREAATATEAARLVAGSGGPIDEQAAARPAYTWMTGSVYRVVARWADPASALVILRLWGCLALVLSVVLCHRLARELWPENALAVWGAPLVMALHPVFVATGSGITPDTWANAAATLCLVLLVRATVGRTSVWEVVGLYLALAAGLAVKDTTYALVACVAAAVPLRLRLARRGLPLGGSGWLFVLTPAGAAAAFLVPVVREAFFSFHVTPAAREQVTLAALPALARDLVPAIGRQIPSYFRSFWGELGNFGATPLGLPAHVLSLLAVLSVAGLLGAFALLAARPHWQPAARHDATRAQVVVLAAGCLAALALAPARSLVGEVADEAQGRWLFPMLAPLLVVGLAGLSWPVREPARLLPLASLLAATFALGTLLAGVVPAYYLEFPSTYRAEQIFLAGSYGSGLDLGRVLPFFERPGWLRDPWVAASPIVGLAVLLVVWLSAVYRHAARLGR